MPSLPDIGFLRRVVLFKDVEDHVLLALWPSFRERRLRKGDVLFRAGDPGEELYLIKDGSIVVSKPARTRAGSRVRSARNSLSIITCPTRSWMPLPATP